MTDIIDDYIVHGWSLVPIPIGSKGPRAAGWNTRKAAIKSSSIVKDLDTRGPMGVGLMHAYSSTMALDIDDWDRTLARGIDVNALYAAPDAVTILSGKQGHGKLLYRMPFGLVLPTKRVQDIEGRKRINVFELRCGTLDDKTVQDVLPPSIHPETQQPYQWGGAGHWSQLPVIPRFLLELWQELVKDGRPVQVDGVGSSWEEIIDALGHIDPDCSREDWINLGMAIHWAGDQTFNGDQAFAIWNSWSSKGAKYPGEREIVHQWRSFRTNKITSVTLGTLFHLARQNGWSRQVPDASTLFGSVEVARPSDIMDSLRPKPPEMDLSLWPSILAERAREVSKSVGCDPLVPLFAGMAAICGVVDAQTRLELMPGFKVPPVLWLMTVGDPGDKKSPGSRPMLAPIKGIEASDLPRYAKAVGDWELKEALYAKLAKERLDFVGTSEHSLGEQAPDLPPLPDKPVPLKITVSDVTSQKLIHLAALRSRGLLCHLDEMNGWVANLVSKFSGENRSAWVVSYEAERYEMDRVGAGSVHCENLAVAIYGNIQPRVLRENFDSLASDGLLQRFLPAILRHDKTKLGHPVPEFLTRAADWENTLRLTYALPALTYRLSPEAFAAFRRFQEWYEEQKGNERLLRSGDAFMTAFGKLEGLAGRLILLFHIIESPFSHVVNSDIVDRVVKMIRQYVIPTYRHLFDECGSLQPFDVWVLEYIIQYADMPGITMADIKKSARRQFEHAGIEQPWQQGQWILNAMYTLEKAGWVARADDGTQEMRGVASWLINPQIKEAFAEYRRTVIRLKDERDKEMLVGRNGGLNLVYGAEELEDVRM